MLRELDAYLRAERMEPGDCLFVPYKEYRSGLQVGELVYHYLAGLVFKEMGYLVCNEFPVAEYDKAKTPRPDLSAFRTPEVEGILVEARRRGVIWAGAFVEEFQLFGVFGRQRYKPRPPDAFEPLTDAQGVAIEVERTESQRRGVSQLRGYLLATMGLFDEGYLAGPSLDLLEGTMAFSGNGELRFRRSAPAYRFDPLPEHLKAKRRAQLESIQATMIVQAFKNLPLPRIVSLCSATYEASSYQALLGAMYSTDFATVLDAVERR